MQHAEAVPAVLDRAEIQRELGRKRQNRRAVMPRGRTGADQHDRVFRALQHIGEGMLAGGEVAERIRARAEIVVGVGEVGLGADQRRS